MKRPQTSDLRPRISSLEHRALGFTLIELLAAMTILVIITLIVSKLFQQASVAWDTGVRKAENTMTGRAVADYIAQDLASAIYDDTLYTELPHSGSTPEFWSLGDSDGTKRAVRKVKYDNASGISRSEDGGTPEKLVESGTTFNIQCVNESPSSLPLYAIVKVTVNDGSRTIQYQSTAYFGQRKRNTF